MAGGVQALPMGIQDSVAVRAVAVVSTNTRVLAGGFPIGTVTDVVSFPGPSTVGNWLVPNQRTLIGGLPSIGATSTGIAIIPGPPPVTGPMTVVQPDTRVSAM